MAADERLELTAPERSVTKSQITRAAIQEIRFNMSTPSGRALKVKRVQ